MEGLKYKGWRSGRIQGPMQVWRWHPKHSVSDLPLAPSLAICNHSPDGFQWGYRGSGPAQLALAILLDATNGDQAIAELAYQDFTLDLQPHHEEEDRHEPVVDPVEQGHLQGPIADEKACVGVPEVLVRRLKG